MPTSRLLPGTKRPSLEEKTLRSPIVISPPSGRSRPATLLSVDPEAGHDPRRQQHRELTVDRQVAIIFAGTQGLLDDVPVEEVRNFEEFLYMFLSRQYAALMPEIANKKELTDEMREALAKGINEAKTEFMMSRGIKAA